MSRSEKTLSGYWFPSCHLQSPPSVHLLLLSFLDGVALTSSWGERAPWAALEKRSMCVSSETLLGVDGLVCAEGELAGGQGGLSGASVSRKGDRGRTDWGCLCQREQSREEGRGPALIRHPWRGHLGKRLDRETGVPGTKVQVGGRPGEVSHGGRRQVLGWRPCAGHSSGETGGPPPEEEGLGLPPHVQTPEAAWSA